MKGTIVILALALRTAACSQAPDSARATTMQAPEARLTAAVIVTPTMPAAGKLARCAISHGGYDDKGNPTKGQSYEGPCLFKSEKGGSFTVSRAGDAPFWTGDDEVTTISVGVEGDDAQVTGISKRGISRWGYGKRLASDRACWSGDEFTVCAR